MRRPRAVIAPRISVVVLSSRGGDRGLRLSGNGRATAEETPDGIAERVADGGSNGDTAGREEKLAPLIYMYLILGGCGASECASHRQSLGPVGLGQVGYDGSGSNADKEITYAAVVAICPNRPGPCEPGAWGATWAGGAAGAYVVAGRVCCCWVGAAGRRAGAAVGRAEDL